MRIYLGNSNSLAGIWHDAEIRSLKLDWSDDGEISVCLRCEINPEEDIKPLLDLGITSRTIEVQFDGVWWLKTDISGYTSSAEVILDWNVVQPSPIINELHSHGMAASLRLVHHQLLCSNGSKIDIVSENIGLDEVVKR